jgi:hypothetical protein
VDGEPEANRSVFTEIELQAIFEYATILPPVELQSFSKNRTRLICDLRAPPSCIGVRLTERRAPSGRADGRIAQGA